MSTLSLKDAKAGLSAYVDEAIGGEFATITRTESLSQFSFRLRQRRSRATP
ncbi:hypothetical protein [Sinorhizobium meliloti]|uniref:hypothetical protein n=1 Tax=Rhizobium meliloti TaxID=382 RepID=UPI0001E4AB1D|nr:hypothetical protein [Sinorhizobium meliloti]AEG55834.1 hypothetical protein Sinme_4141 [Sinorhizobium meliloti AK83]MDE4587497.1 hypothetical protein [Sinorhizobium meliloti]SEI50266.1 hypothetical protein SAMN04244575_00774 [Sinorhizobium meliloti]